MDIVFYVLIQRNVRRTKSALEHSLDSRDILREYLEKFEK